MLNKLQQYFPSIRTRAAILNDIRNNDQLQNIFDSWNEKQQNAFLDACTGVRGVKLLYDSFFKEILSPESTPERLSELLSLILNEKVTVIQALPTDSIRIADEMSLLIMDIVVRLNDGSIANLEIQKIGYLFPGQRSACYSADLLLRQYKRVRSTKGKRFSYRDIKPVYTIILFDQSPSEFHHFPNTYIHRSEQQSDTGIQIPLLQKFVFIPLDIFRKNIENSGISNRLNAWLAFLSVDDPDWIIKICTRHPDFKAMYEQVYDLCQNIEKVMTMFSKELLEMDRNTVQYMIDEMQEEIDQSHKELIEQKEQLSQLNLQINQQEEQISQQNHKLNLQEEQISQQTHKLNLQEEQISQQTHKLNQAHEKQIDMIRHVMHQLNLTADEALEALGIAVEEQEELKKKL